MKNHHKVLLASAVLFLTQTSLAGKEILVVGDSWANFLCLSRGYTKTLEKYTDSQYIENTSCLKTSKNGMKAAEWLGSDEHRKLISELIHNRNIKLIHLSLGGNDILDKVNIKQTEAEQKEKFEEIYTVINDVINQILALRSDTKVIVSGYDYPRFTRDHKIPFYRKILKKLGYPTPEQLNTTLIKYQSFITEKFYTKNYGRKRVFVINHMGLSHYLNGVKEGNIPSQVTLHPDYISTLAKPNQFGGEPQYMSDERSMKNWGLGIHDAFHLTPAGYQGIAEHVYRNIITKIK